MPSLNLFDQFEENYAQSQVEYLDLSEYLDLCKADPMAYATAAERMVKAIGDPVRLDTSSDARLSRIFLNRTLRTYPAFAEFFGMEDTVERIVATSATPPRASKSASRSSTCSARSAAASRRSPNG
jgi:serine protein kinase